MTDTRVVCRGAYKLPDAQVDTLPGPDKLPDVQDSLRGGNHITDMRVVCRGPYKLPDVLEDSLRGGNHMTDTRVVCRGHTDCPMFKWSIPGPNKLPKEDNLSGPHKLPYVEEDSPRGGNDITDTLVMCRGAYKLRDVGGESLRRGNHITDTHVMCRGAYKLPEEDTLQGPNKRPEEHNRSGPHKLPEEESIRGGGHMSPPCTPWMPGTLGWGPLAR
jgi:hypothetical protein